MKFFPKNRRGVTLEKAFFKRNAQKEQRLRIDFSMVLSAANLRLAPDEVQESYSAICKDKNISQATIDTVFKAQNISVFELPEDQKKNDKPILVLEAADITNVSVFRPHVEDGADEEVYCVFRTTITRTAKNVMFAHNYLGATVFTLFEEGQPELKEAPEKEAPKQTAFPTQGQEQKAAVSKIRSTAAGKVN